MANNGIPAVFGINKYLWNQLQVQNIIPNTDPYGGLTPIVPIQESSQLLQAIDASNPNQTSAPYIVYHWYTNNIDAKSWFKQEDTLVYTVYALDQKVGRQILLLLVDSFKRFDLSARAVNNYIQSSGLSQDYKDYLYQYISVRSATGGTSTTIENDPTTFTVTLRVCYSNPTVDIPLP